MSGPMGLPGIYPAESTHVLSRHSCDNLGPHVQLRISLDYLFFDSWDGSGNHGPDYGYIYVDTIEKWKQGRSWGSGDDDGDRCGASNWADKLMEVLLSRGVGDDIVEICGGEARVSQVCVRRSLSIGGNFDILTECDLRTR